MKYLFFLWLLVGFYACRQQTSEKGIGHHIALASGVDNFENIEMLEFIKIPGNVMLYLDLPVVD